VLLERSAQGVRLTPAGHGAMQPAMRLSQGFDLFGGELAEFAQGYRGHVRPWANMSALTEFLPEVLGALHGPAC
jgi:DNA-binding transcriptional LysR family regulator